MLRREDDEEKEATITRRGSQKGEGRRSEVQRAYRSAGEVVTALQGNHELRGNIQKHLSHMRESFLAHLEGGGGGMIKSRRRRIGEREIEAFMDA